MKIKNILIAMLLIVLFFPISTYASNTYEKYLALGDSIAAGIGLKDVRDGYSYIVKNELNIKDENFKNFAITGTTAKKFNKLVRTQMYTKAIKEADLITISIGANEILKTISQNFIEISGITKEQTRDLEVFNKLMTEKVSGKGIEGLKDLYALVSSLYDRLNSDEVNAELIQKIEQYRNEWQQGIDYIKEINPNATIIVTEFYNPYYNLNLLYDWGEYADKYIREFNEKQYEISNNETKYKIARIYEDFNVENPRLTNVSIDRSAFSIDPHPNIEGHKAIAKSVLKTLEKEEIAKAEAGINVNLIIIISSVIVIILVLTLIIVVIKTKNKKKA